MRLRTTAERLARFDPILDIVNIASGVISIAVVVIVTAATAT